MLWMLREEGQGLVEYGLILILIAVAIAVLAAVLGNQIGELFSRVADAFN